MGGVVRGTFLTNEQTAIYYVIDLVNTRSKSEGLRPEKCKAAEYTNVYRYK